MSKSGFKKRADGKYDTGRPTKMTPETINKLEYAFSLGCSDLEACFYAEISPSTLYEYQKVNVGFSDRKAMLREKMMFKARKVIDDFLENGDINTARWYAERKRKDEFATRSEFTGKDGDSLSHKVYVTAEDVDMVETHIDEFIAN